MKKLLLPLAALAILSACNTTPKYTINGTVEGEETGNVYLVKYLGKSMDTLAKAPINQGKFVITGKVDSLTDAYLLVEGKRNWITVFVENATYTAKLNPTGESTVTGTPTQELANKYMAIYDEVNKSQRELRQEYSAAAQANDMEKMAEIENKFNALGEAAEAKEDSLTKANSDTYIAAYMVASRMGSMDIEELKAQYETLGSNAKATAPGKKIAERIEKLKAVAIGQVAPDFTLTTPQGESVSLHAIPGKVKLVDFWASWCAPCRGENPNVVKIYEEFHPKGLEILGVSLDNDKEAWVKAIEDDKLTWNHVSDLEGWQSEVAQLYAVNGIPHMLILDENNVIVAKNLRGEQLREKIAELLK